MNPKWQAFILCVGTIAFGVTANAMWMRPEQEEVPIDRLIENLKGFIEKHPETPEGYFTLGRLYSFAYARRTTTFDVYVRGDLWEPAINGANIPSSPGCNTPAVTPERLNYLIQSIKYYRDAIAKRNDDMMYWLGVGYDYGEAADHAGEITWPFTGSPFDEEAKAKSKDKRFWEDLALDAYRKAFALDTKREGGVSLPVAAEAGGGILSILGRRTDRTEAENKEIRRMKRAVSAMSSGPRAITPVIFSMEDRPLKSILSQKKRVSFDLDGTGRRMRWNWVRPGTAFLAWDPQETGQILSGRQLFGSTTWWMFWRNGYLALAALDDDGNGWLEGAELKGVAVWRDLNGNGRSEVGEVSPVQSQDITGVNVSVSDTVSGMLSSRLGIRFADGHTVATYDWVTIGYINR